MSKDEFDSEMKKMGVRRIDADGSSRPKTVRIARSSTPPAGHGKRRPDAAATRKLDQPSPAVLKLQAEVEEANRRCKEVEGEVQGLKDALAQAHSSQESAEARNAQLLVELQEPTQGSVSLKEMLFQRGVLGQDEQHRAFEGLFQRKLWEGILPMLRVDRPGRLQERLSQDLFLHCGSAACRAPKSVVCLEVMPERCEVCGGAEWSAASASDALLLNGYRVVILYGGHPHQHALLRDGLDSRIRFRAAPAGQAAEKPPEKSGEVRIYWEGTRSDPAGDCPDHAGCVAVPDSSLAGLVRTVVYELGRR